LNRLALWHLDRSAELPPAAGGGELFCGPLRLRLWDDAKGFGTGGGPITLSVYELFEDDYRRIPVVREAIWNRRADLRLAYEEVPRTEQKVEFEPTITVRDEAVPAEAFEALLAEATAFRVPVVW